MKSNFYVRLRRLVTLAKERKNERALRKLLRITLKRIGQLEDIIERKENEGYRVKCRCGVYNLPSRETCLVCGEKLQ